MTLTAALPSENGARGREKSPRVLLVINAFLRHERDGIRVSDDQPRTDYVEVTRLVGADIVALGDGTEHRRTRVAGRIRGTSISQAWVAFRLSARYDAVYCDRETSGFVLAVLLKLRRRRPRLVVLGHRISLMKKWLPARLARVHKQIDGLIVHSSMQQRAAIEKLHMPPEKIEVLPYQTDEKFWKPVNLETKRQICSAGLESRDYHTLVEAVRSLDVDLVIAAASRWSRHAPPSADSLPPGVTVTSLDHARLRDLYAESLFVVVPLLDVDNQAGITTTLEAMAMGKAVIVTRTPGQIDIVQDRRGLDGTPAEGEGRAEMLRSLGASPLTASSPTGIYVRPGDVADLRRAIVYLLEHPDEAREMGANGRRLIEETMGLDRFVRRLAAIITGGEHTHDAEMAELSDPAQRSTG